MGCCHSAKKRQQADADDGDRRFAGLGVGPFVRTLCCPYGPRVAYEFNITCLHCLARLRVPAFLQGFAPLIQVGIVNERHKLWPIHFDKCISGRISWSDAKPVPGPTTVPLAAIQRKCVRKISYVKAVLSIAAGTHLRLQKFKWSRSPQSYFAASFRLLSNPNQVLVHHSLLNGQLIYKLQQFMPFKNFAEYTWARHNFAQFDANSGNQLPQGGLWSQKSDDLMNVLQDWLSDCIGALAAVA